MKKNINSFEKNAINSNSNIYYNYSNSKEDFELIITNNPFKASRKKKGVKDKTKVQNLKSTKLKKTINKHRIKFPIIKYYGFVKSEKSTKPLVLLRVNNQLYRKRVGEKFIDIYIIKTYNDSLIISLQDSIKTVLK